MRAADALDAAREAVKVDALWDAADVDWGRALTFRWDDLPGVAPPRWRSLRTMSPTTWGDIEPTDYERESLEVYVIAVVTDDGDVLDAVWEVSASFPPRRATAVRPNASCSLWPSWGWLHRPYAR